MTAGGREFQVAGMV